MPTTYSTSLRLSLIGTGEQSGNWGNITNTNLGTLLEQAITGYVQVTVSGSGDTTLVAGFGISDEARNAVIELVGAPGANRNLIIPAVEKVYLIQNSVTGDYAMTVKTSGGSGVAVPPGAATLVYCNGTQTFQATPHFSPSTGAMVLNGALAVNGTTAISGALTANTLASVAGLTVGGPVSANGNIIVSTASPTFTLNKGASGQANSVYGNTSGATRWSMILGDETAESGGNAGSNLVIGRWNDAGTYLDAPITVSRATGVVDFAQTPTVSGISLMPTGVILEYGGFSAPSGWLLAQGQAVSRTTYANLFAVIGTAYGAGDGSTTFNLPDKRDRFTVGAGASYSRGATGGSATTSSAGTHNHTGAAGNTTLTEAQIPAHSHTGYTDTQGYHDHGTGLQGISWGFAGNPANMVQQGSGLRTDGNGSHTHNIQTYNTGGGGSHNHTISTDGAHTHTATPPYIASNFIIKT